MLLPLPSLQVLDFFFQADLLDYESASEIVQVSYFFGRGGFFASFDFLRSDGMLVWIEKFLF